MTSDGARLTPPHETRPSEPSGSPRLQAHGADAVAWTVPNLTGRLARGATAGALAVADQGVVSATSLLTSIIVARACGQSTFGVFILGLSIIMLLLELQGALVSTPYLVNAPPLAGAEARRFGGSALLHQLGLAALTSLGLVLATLVLAERVPGLESVGWALAAGAPFITLRDFLRRHCFARLRLGSALGMDVGVALIQVGGLAWLAAAAWLSATGALVLVAAASGIAALAWLAVNRDDFAPRLRDARVDAARHWSVGRWVFASGVAWALAAQLYPWLLAMLRGAADVGVWGAAVGVSALLNVPFLAGQNLLGPWIANAKAVRGTGEFRGFVLRVSAGFGVALLMAAVPLFLFGGWLLRLLYGSEYAAYGDVVALLAAGIALSAASFGLSRGLFCMDRADLDFVVNLLPLAGLLLLGPPLIDGRGVLGAAAALAAAHVLSAAARWAALVLATSRAAEVRRS